MLKFLILIAVVVGAFADEGTKHRPTRQSIVIPSTLPFDGIPFPLTVPFRGNHLVSDTAYIPINLLNEGPWASILKTLPLIKDKEVEMRDRALREREMWMMMREREKEMWEKEVREREMKEREMLEKEMLEREKMKEEKLMLCDKLGGRC